MVGGRGEGRVLKIMKCQVLVDLVHVHAERWSPHFADCNMIFELRSGTINFDEYMDVMTKQATNLDVKTVCAHTLLSEWLMVQVQVSGNLSCNLLLFSRLWPC